MGRPSSTSAFLHHVREAGGSIGNGQLREKLGWDEKKYWKVHQELVDSGVITRGRGQGGRVILFVPETEVEAEQIARAFRADDREAVVDELASASQALSEREDVKELDLYEPALGQLKMHWQRRKSLTGCVCEKTALQGRRETGGSWSRPDLVAVGMRKFEYIPDRVLEVYTFEIKPAYDVSIKGVLEALAHREVATRSYVIFHTNEKPWDEFSEAQRIEELATRHGVGVIVASKIDSIDEGWDERVNAVRSNSDPERIESFIKSTLSESAKSQIRLL